VAPYTNQALSGLHRFSNQHRTRTEYIEWDEGEGALFHYDALAVCQNILPLLSRSWHSNTKHSPIGQALHSIVISPLGCTTPPDFTQNSTSNRAQYLHHIDRNVWSGYGNCRGLVSFFAAWQWGRQAGLYKRTIGERLSDHCCCRIALSITYSGCVSVFWP